MPLPDRPWTCRTNLHHAWEWAKTPDGKQYERCSRCHKEKDDSDPQGMKTAGFSLGGGGF